MGFFCLFVFFIKKIDTDEEKKKNQQYSVR